MSSGIRRLEFLAAAQVDLRRLMQRSPNVVREVLRTLKQLQQREIDPVPLSDYAKTGDLSDCGKLLVVVEGEPDHRIVVRESGGVIEVCEVIAVEAREGDLPYLLAGIRLGRLTDPVRRSDAQRRIDRIRRMLDS